MGRIAAYATECCPSAVRGAGFWTETCKPSSTVNECTSPHLAIVEQHTCTRTDRAKAAIAILLGCCAVRQRNRSRSNSGVLSRADAKKELEAMLVPTRVPEAFENLFVVACVLPLAEKWKERAQHARTPTLVRPRYIVAHAYARERSNDQEMFETSCFSKVLPSKILPRDTRWRRSEALQVCWCCCGWGCQGGSSVPAPQSPEAHSPRSWRGSELVNFLLLLLRG